MTLSSVRTFLAQNITKVEKLSEIREKGDKGQDL